MPTPTPTVARNGPGWNSLVPVEIAPKASTAKIAPTGSIRIPSHFRTAPTRSVGRMWSSSGRTTVGPESERTAPSRIAIRVSRSSNNAAASATSAQVIAKPALTRRDTTCPTPALEIFPVQEERALEQDHAHRKLDHRVDQVAKQLVGVERVDHVRAKQHAGDQQRDDRRHAQPQGDDLGPHRRGDDQCDGECVVHVPPGRGSLDRPGNSRRSA